MINKEKLAKLIAKRLRKRRLELCLRHKDVAYDADIPFTQS